jgi:hypothetical protein
MSPITGMVTPAALQSLMPLTVLPLRSTQTALIAQVISATELKSLVSPVASISLSMRSKSKIVPANLRKESQLLVN